AALRKYGLPRIVIADQIDAAARAHLASAAELIDVEGTNLPALLAALPEADALVVRSETQVTEEVLAAGHKLRVVARAGVGVDNVDLDAATRRGVIVLNAPGANRISAGEHTIALLLAVTRQINFADSTTRAGEWARKRIKPIDLQGKTVGIVGLGRVGSVVATRLKAFEMTVLAYDPFIRAERFEELGVEPVSYLDLLSRVDIDLSRPQYRSDPTHARCRTSGSHAPWCHRDQCCSRGCGRSGCPGRGGPLGSPARCRC
ncbi:MAG TPA: NAD(P)-dependent oxidoreductase, partial [Thermomicrobiales bacterium]|nr:NAD(P)-dependent oxidoreductase [Thermomicrobiales bacterium]